MIVNLCNVASIAEQLTRTKMQTILLVLYLRKAGKYGFTRAVSSFAA